MTNTVQLGLRRLLFSILTSSSRPPLSSASNGTRRISTREFLTVRSNVVPKPSRMSLSNVVAPVPVSSTEGKSGTEKIKLEEEAKQAEQTQVQKDSGTDQVTVTESVSVAVPSEDIKKEPYVRIKKRKIVLMMSYCGQGYYGMQVQKGGDTVATIEEELLKSMLKCNYFTQDEIRRPQSFCFQRAARTDKHVSAARQIVSLKAPETLEVAKLNEVLPSCIRVMGMKRVTQGFDAKTQCSARTYAYMTPTFAFAPIETNLTEGYRVTPEVLANVRRLLAKYVGTKNFFNFTSGKKCNDPSAQRHILSFECSDPFVKDGLEYCILRVKGQSFMLHQIRKMIGLCTAILRGFAHEDIFKSAFGKERIDVPKAPGLGLMLEQVHYDGYNNKFGSDGVHLPITWDEEKVEVEKFCDEFIYPVVTETENKEKSMWNWLATLVYHTYAVRPHDNRSAEACRSEIGKAGARAASEAGIPLKSTEDDDDEEEDDEGESKPKRQKIRKN